MSWPCEVTWRVANVTNKKQYSHSHYPRWTASAFAHVQENGVLTRRSVNTEKRVSKINARKSYKPPYKLPKRAGEERGAQSTKHANN